MKGKLSALSLITGFALALACGSGGTEFGSAKRGWAAPPLHDPTVGHGELVVPPDEARMAILLQLSEASAASTSTGLLAAVDALEAAVAEVETCRVELRDVAPPMWDDYEEEFLARAAIDAVVDLRGATDVRARIQRLDACREALLAQAAVKPASGSRRMVVGEVVLVVDAPERALGELLARRAGELSALQVAAAPLHPEELRCVPKGVVVGERSLSGVVLRLDQECRVEKLTHE